MVEDRAGQLALRFHARGQPFRQRPFALHQIMSERAPRPVLLDEVRAGQDDAVVQRGDRAVDVLLGEPGRFPQFRPCQRPCLAYRFGHPQCRALGLAAVRGDERRHEPWRDARDDPREVLPDADEPTAGSSSFAPQRKLISSLQRTNVPSGSRTAQLRSGLPFTCSHSDGSTTSAFGRSSARPTSSTKAAACSTVRTMRSSLQECPRSGHFAPSATTRPSPARSSALVAPPYDVISDAQRSEYLARSPYNIVHLTLPDSEGRPARDLAAWRDQRCSPRARALLVGRPGLHRPRRCRAHARGHRAAVPAAPYDDGAVLPHERTHAGPKEGRLRLLRATRTQLEPIFLLYDATRRSTAGEASLRADVAEGGVRTRIWRVEAGELQSARRC